MVSGGEHLPLALVSGEGWHQLSELALAFVLSSLIGLEREIRQKAAGLRTHALVGTGAALFLIVSKYGFNDVLTPGRVVVDPSRVAAGIVAGIGFIGGGLIFVRRESVRGLTTAAIIWITAAIGMACGAGLLRIALLVTAAHFVVVLVFPLIERRLPRTARTETTLRVVYRQKRGILRTILAECTGHGFAVTGIHTREDESDLAPRKAVEVTLELEGAQAPSELGASLHEIDGVLEVRAADTAGSSY
jgi:putative Mg2+ transporter-C (MgtC) family protein